MDFDKGLRPYPVQVVSKAIVGQGSATSFIVATVDS
jgi:hypothetical protein